MQNLVLFIVQVVVFLGTMSEKDYGFNPCYGSCPEFSLRTFSFLGIKVKQDSSNFSGETLLSVVVWGRCIFFVLESDYSEEFVSKFNKIIYSSRHLQQRRD